MRSVSISGGIIVEMPGREQEVDIDDGKKVKVFERNAVVIVYGSDKKQNDVKIGGMGRALVDEDAWDRAVEECKKQL